MCTKSRQVNVNERIHLLVKDAAALRRSHDLRTAPSALLDTSAFGSTSRGKVQAKGEMYFVRLGS